MGRTILLERRQTKYVGRRDDCLAFCDLIGRGQSLAESGRRNGLGRSENKRPETRRFKNSKKNTTIQRSHAKRGGEYKF
ncbi:hypothetical protein TNCV_1060271 [Trichonephila clavipes]|nr:hypothetical protein TNCV_1060271 [Trichonephila clavipes]